MATGKYIRALGLDSEHKVRTELSIEGAAMWGISKAPAVAGGLWAEWVYRWAAKKWPDTKRGPEFVGGVCVVVGAYAVQVLAARYQPDASHLVDRITDGMLGRISAVIWNLLSGLFDKDKRAVRVADPNLSQGKPTNGLGAASLDGDRDAVMDAAALLRDSPETTQAMADEMFKVMARDGVDINGSARQELVQSLRQVTTSFAAGQF